MKPQFAPMMLDAVDSWPHRWGMAADRTPPKAGASTNRQAEIEAQREAKLAQALRANLRRRKAEPKRRPGAEPAEPGDGDST